jgi:hypothetical protein
LLNAFQDARYLAHRPRVCWRRFAVQTKAGGGVLNNSAACEPEASVEGLIALRIASGSTFIREDPRQKPVGLLGCHGFVKLLP